MGSLHECHLGTPKDPTEHTNLQKSYHLFRLTFPQELPLPCSLLSHFHMFRPLITLGPSGLACASLYLPTQSLHGMASSPFPINLLLPLLQPDSPPSATVHPNLRR